MLSQVQEGAHCLEELPQECVSGLKIDIGIDSLIVFIFDEVVVAHEIADIGELQHDELHPNQPTCFLPNKFIYEDCQDYHDPYNVDHNEYNCKILRCFHDC